MDFASKDDALHYHSASINAGSSAVTEPFEQAADATESFWRSAHPLNDRAQRLLQVAGQIEQLSEDITSEMKKPTNVFEKALWQRDLICALQAVLHCQAIESNKDQKPRWERIKNALLRALEQAVFTGAEYHELQKRLPAAPSAKYFVNTCRCRLADDYLPPVVLGASANWYELPTDEDPGLHFQAYEGRTFVRIFLTAPGISKEEFFDYWTKVTKRFGMNVTVSAAVPGLPPGTETVLLRTFGLFLDDGSYVDSRMPEEVLVRIFKYAGATLDAQTSDGLGTLHYQYKLRRNQLLDDPATLGLVRIHDADAQFYGFFAEVPEPGSSEHLTTTRANCISCHSELLYGASTIFSLCRRSPAVPEPSRVEGGRLEKWGKGWRIKQECLHTIQSELMARLATGHDTTAKRGRP
jgi:hypothetical protein